MRCRPPDETRTAQEILESPWTGLDLAQPPEIFAPNLTPEVSAFRLPVGSEVTSRFNRAKPERYVLAQALQLLRLACCRFDGYRYQVSGFPGPHLRRLLERFRQRRLLLA